jgi:hypothetical protein
MLRQTILLLAGAVAAGAQTDVSGLAAGVLDQTKQARQAIAAHDRDGAIAHVRNAMATVSLIQQNSPNAPRPLMVPIYRSIETTTTVTPVKKHDEMKHNSSIRGVEGNTTSTELDVTATGDRLPGAMAALQSGDWNSADSTLAAIENSVTVSESTGEMPLRMALKNLELAKTRVADGKYHDAEMPLKSAAQALGDYEKGVSAQEAANVEAARQAMLGLAPHVGHDRDTAATRIDSWLAMVRQWSNDR